MRTSEDRAPIERTVPANGLAMHYLVWGPQRGRVLVLLHGGGQSAWTWQRVAEQFAPRYRILAPDLRGHGDTSWPPDGQYSMDAFRADLAAFATALKFDQFVLVGMSLGGMAALSYAGSYGAHLRGLVIVDIAPEIQPAGRDRLVGFMGGRDSFASLDEVVEYAHAFNPRRSRDTLRQTLPRNLRTLPDGRLTWKWDPNFMRLPLRDAVEMEQHMTGLWDAARCVPCPTLVVHGQDSDILHPEAGQRLAQTLPHGRFVSIAGAGHSVQGDNPHSLAEALAEFLHDISY